MMTKIVAFDFETANRKKTSAISLGVVVTEDGKEIYRDVMYFRPPTGGWFEFTELHGLTYDDVKDKPTFGQYYERIQKHFADAVLLAHNASFDLDILNACCEHYNRPKFENPTLDTLSIARICLPELHKHSLDVVCDRLRIPLNHHEALSDAYGCIGILNKTMDMTNSKDLFEFIDYLGKHEWKLRNYRNQTEVLYNAKSLIPLRPKGREL